MVLNRLTQGYAPDMRMDHMCGSHAIAGIT